MRTRRRELPTRISDGEGCEPRPRDGMVKDDLDVNSFVCLEREVHQEERGGDRQ